MAKKPSALSKLNSPACNEASLNQPYNEIANRAAVPTAEHSEPQDIKTHVECEKGKCKKFSRKKKTSALDKVVALPLDNTPVENETVIQNAVTPMPQPKMEIAPEDPPVIPDSNAPCEAPLAPASSSINYADYEAELDAQELMRNRREQRAAMRSASCERIGLIAMAIACVYLLFLIYGALKTDYTYNEDGRLVAQKLSFQELKALDNFETIQNEYIQARRLYETILKLDYRMAAGIEDPLLIAPEYEKVLEQVDQLVIQIKATEIKDVKYNQVHSMLEAWVGTDAAVYCQKMSAAISRNDAQAASDALVMRNAMYNDFTIISENILALGSDVQGAELDNIKNWSPEKYISDNIDGMGGES